MANNPVEAEDTADSELVTASMGRRFVAILIDLVVLSVVATPVFLVFDEPLLALPGERATLPLVISTAIPLAIESAFLMRYSATIGKLIQGVYVARLAGERISAPQAVFRKLVLANFFIYLWLPYGLPIVILIGAVSTIIAFSNTRRRSLHDRLSGTRILRGTAPHLGSQTSP